MALLECESAAASAAGQMVGEIQPLSDRVFRLLRALIERETGIHLGDSKKALVVGRLAQRLRALGLRSFEAYYRLVSEGPESERACMFDRICTNETRFFRESRQFDLLRDHVFPGWKERASAGKRARRIRVWSAACSSGEEAYSLAMTLLGHFPAQLGWDVSVLATDLSTVALDCARSGAYPPRKAFDIPPRYSGRYMRKDPQRDGQLLAGPEIRGIVEFKRVNLNERSYPVAKPFDLIFCRNVLIYFAMPTKQRVINKLLDLVSPDGYLFLGHAESLVGLSDRVRAVGLNAYTTSTADPQ